MFTDQTMYEMCENEINSAISSIMGSKYKKINNKHINSNCNNNRILDERELDKVMYDLKSGKTLSKYFKTNYLFYIDASNFLDGQCLNTYHTKTFVELTKKILIT